MIKKLQMRLIAVSMLSLLLVLIVIVGSINLFPTAASPKICR